MRNFFRGGLYFLTFAVVGIIFQISCSADASNVSQNETMLNKVIYAKNTFTSDGIKIYTCNYDGTNQTEVVITLPPNIFIFNGASQHATPRLSPDGQKIFFLAYNPTDNNQTYLYSANIDGSNPIAIVEGIGGQLEIGNVN